MSGLTTDGWEISNQVHLEKRRGIGYPVDEPVHRIEKEDQNMVGDKIKSLRKAKKLTQEQLAEYLNISSQAVSKWETGASSPDIDMLPRLAVFFQTSVDER